MSALDDGSCPSGLFNCQPDTISYQDTVCVADLDECPIVAVKFTQSSSSGDSVWKAVSMPEGGSILYSTRDSRFGPIASTYVGRWPCLDPAQEANFEDSKNLYPIERTSAQESCTIDIDGAPVLDNRYSRIEGIQISEYDV